MNLCDAIPKYYDTRNRPITGVARRPRRLQRVLSFGLLDRRDARADGKDRQRCAGKSGQHRRSPQNPPIPALNLFAPRTSISNLPSPKYYPTGFSPQCPAFASHVCKSVSSLHFYAPINSGRCGYPCLIPADAWQRNGARCDRRPIW